MDVIVSPGLLHSLENVIFQHCIAFATPAPAKTRSAVRPRSQRKRATQADADVVPPAQAGCQSQDLLLVASLAMEEHEQGVGIVGLVAGGEKRADRKALRTLQNRVVETLFRS